MTPSTHDSDEPSPEEVREELDFYLRERTEELVAQGMEPSEAARAARAAFGDRRRIEAQVLDEASRARSGDRRRIAVQAWLTDIRLAWRGLRRNPGFSLGVILLLATGIGASTTVFAVVDAVALRPLPYPEPNRLVELEDGLHSPADFVIWEDEVSAIETWGGIWNDQADLTGDGPPERIPVGRISEDFFEVLGARAEMGRLFGSDDFGPDAGIAVLDYDFWQRRWGGDPEIVGREIRLGGVPISVVGVLDPAFDPLILGEGPLGGPPSVWLPADLEGLAAQGHGVHVFRVVGRLADGVGVEAAREEMRAMSESLLDRGFPNHANRDGSARQTPPAPLEGRVIGSAGATGAMLLAAVGFLLLIACANAANLFLARGTKRTREMALKGAIGASRSNLARQLTAESLGLSLAGGAVGVLLAVGGVWAFRVLEPGALARADYASLNLRVLMFAVAVSVATGLLFGLLPALRAARTEPSRALKEDARSASEGRQRRRARNALVIAEVALSVVLVAGAGILFHSFVNLIRVDTGMEATSELVTVDLQLLEHSPEERARIVDGVLEEVQARVPGVGAVFAAPSLPFQFTGGEFMGRHLTYAPPDSEPVEMLLHPVTRGYFSGLGIPILSGRRLEAGDAELDPVPVVVDERLAREVFDEASPLGETFEILPGVNAQVVGVARDVRFAALDREPTTTLYMPWETFGPEVFFTAIGIRTSMPLEAVAPIVREAVWARDATVPVPELSTMELRVSRSVAHERFLSTLLGVFALVAAAMAAGGLYGSLLYTARQRGHEMGIRVAIGAERRDLIGMVMREGAILTMAGLALGLVGVWMGGQVLEGYVFGIAPRDPFTIAVVAALLGIVALAVSLVPAVRATRIEPMSALRAE